jgi:hypothetical protein
MRETAVIERLRTQLIPHARRIDVQNLDPLTVIAVLPTKAGEAEALIHRYENDAVPDMTPRENQLAGGGSNKWAWVIDDNENDITTNEVWWLLLVRLSRDNILSNDPDNP